MEQAKGIKLFFANKGSTESLHDAHRWRPPWKKEIANWYISLLSPLERQKPKDPTDDKKQNKEREAAPVTTSNVISSVGWRLELEGRAEESKGAKIAVLGYWGYFLSGVVIAVSNQKDINVSQKKYPFMLLLIGVFFAERRSWKI
jgi:hypothetical protein